jgi:hypothetical protein
MGEDGALTLFIPDIPVDPRLALFFQPALVSPPDLFKKL